MPKLFDMEGYVPDLKINIYSSCDAPLKFYEYLNKGLAHQGVYSSYHYPCIFKSDTVTIVAWVDKCIFVSIKM